MPYVGTYPLKSLLNFLEEFCNPLPNELDHCAVESEILIDSWVVTCWHMHKEIKRTVLNWSTEFGKKTAYLSIVSYFGLIFLAQSAFVLNIGTVILDGLTFFRSIFSFLCPSIVIWFFHYFDAWVKLWCGYGHYWSIWPSNDKNGERILSSTKRWK